MDPEPAHLVRGRKTRERVLRYTRAVATEEGLDALTLGRVAENTGLTKAGLLGHFGSKEALQLATLEAGQRAFVAAVITPTAKEPEGLPALVELLDRWIAHASCQRGGCFFASVAAEFDGRPGPVRDQIASLVKAWIGELRRRIVSATALGQLRSDHEPKELAFRLYGCELTMNLRIQLLADPRAVAEARATMIAILADCATPLGLRTLKGTKKSKRTGSRMSEGRQR